jgi:hypothetical protein
LCANTTSPRTEVCARTCACAQLCVCMPAWHAPPHARTYTRTHARTYRAARTRTRTYTRTRACAPRMCTRARAHARTRTCTQAHAHANARTHTYTHGGGRTGDPCSDQPVLQRLTGQRAVPSMQCSPTYLPLPWVAALQHTHQRHMLLCSRLVLAQSVRCLALCRLRDSESTS